MGWCLEFGARVHPGCDTPMVAGVDSCSCPVCTVVCPGRFNGCRRVWERGPHVVRVHLAPSRPLHLEAIPPATNGHAPPPVRGSDVPRPLSDEAIPSPSKTERTTPLRLQGEIEVLRQMGSRGHRPSAESSDADAEQPTALRQPIPLRQPDGTALPDVTVPGSARVGDTQSLSPGARYDNSAAAFEAAQSDAHAVLDEFARIAAQVATASHTISEWRSRLDLARVAAVSGPDELDDELHDLRSLASDLHGDGYEVHRTAAFCSAFCEVVDLASRAIDDPSLVPAVARAESHPEASRFAKALSAAARGELNLPPRIGVHPRLAVLASPGSTDPPASMALGLLVRQVSDREAAGKASSPRDDRGDVLHARPVPRPASVEELAEAGNGENGAGGDPVSSWLRDHGHLGILRSLSLEGGDRVVADAVEQQAAAALIAPLSELNWTFEDPVLLSQVLAICNYSPEVLDHFARELVRVVPGRRGLDGATMRDQVLTSSDVGAVFTSEPLRSSLRVRLDLTLSVDPRCKAIAYKVAQQAHRARPGRTLEAKDLRRQCTDAMPEAFGDLSDEGFEALVVELVRLGVLRRVGSTLCLRSPELLDLLGSPAEVDDVLSSGLLVERSPGAESLGRVDDPPPSASLPVRAPDTNGLHTEFRVGADAPGIRDRASTMAPTDTA